MKILNQLVARSKIFEYGIYIAFCLADLALHFVSMTMSLLSLKQNKVACCNMKGKRYADNPKYITRELLRSGENIDIVWFVKNPDKEKGIEGIRFVKYGSVQMLLELVTANVWIDSNFKMPGLYKRSKQYYIQTWHGSYGLKKIYGDIEDKISLIDKKFAKGNTQHVDLMVSNSGQCTEIFRRAFRYTGEIIEQGSPRNDVFFENRAPYLNRVRSCFEIKEKKIILYAPTYRNNMQLDCFNMDYEQVIECAERRFGGRWIMMVRLHPRNIQDAAGFIKYSDRIINASEYDDMQELLVAADMLITDYSSCMFDFLTGMKPCFLYALDRDRYKKERDYYFELEELPFPLAESNDELKNNILNFDEERYKRDAEGLFERVKLNETGHASKIIAQRVIEKIKHEPEG